jgi:hypothetical protein
MNLSQIQNRIKYVTNAAGEKTEAIVPVEIWETLINLLQAIESGLDLIDENEPKAAILADLLESIQQARIGQTYPISQLWNAIKD